MAKRPKMVTGAYVGVPDSDLWSARIRVEGRLVRKGRGNYITFFDFDDVAHIENHALRGEFEKRFLVFGLPLRIWGAYDVQRRLAAIQRSCEFFPRD